MSKPFKRQVPDADWTSAQIGDPIEFIRQEHSRQFEICDELEELPNALDSALDLDWARSIQSFLFSDLPMHVEDEELDLFPILSERCRGYEGLDLMLSQLSSEHQLDLDLVEPIKAELQAILEGGAPRNRGRFLMNLRAFAETQRRHLLWENRIVLPLAEKHLTGGDRKALSRKLTLVR